MTNEEDGSAPKTILAAFPSSPPPMAVAARQAFSAYGCAIALESNSVMLVEELARLFRPYAQTGPLDGGGHFRMFAIVDSSAFATLSTRFERLTGAHDQQHAELYPGVFLVRPASIATGLTRVWHLATRATNTIYSFLCDASADVVYELFRMARALFSVAFLDNQLLPIHAAAVSRNDRILCLLGDRFAGKTTLAIECLERHAWDFVSNDTCYLDLVSPDLTAVALPIRSGVRWSSVARSPTLRSFVDEIHPERRKDDRLYLTPSEISDLFRVKVAATGIVDALVFLDRKPFPIEAELTPLARSDLYDQLAKHTLSDDALYYNHFWQEFFGRRPGGQLVLRDEGAPKVATLTYFDSADACAILASL